MGCLTSIIHPSDLAAVGALSAGVVQPPDRSVILILGSGYDSIPAVGPGGRGSTSPGTDARRDRARVCAGQGALARAQIRSQARAMSAAQGQEAWIFSCRRRPPRTSRPAA